MEISRTSRVRRSLDVSFRAIAEETWIVSLRDSVLHRLNATASRVWELLGGEPTVAEIGAVLAVEFDVDEARAAADVEGLVRAMASKGLVEILPQPGHETAGSHG